MFNGQIVSPLGKIFYKAEPVATRVVRFGLFFRWQVKACFNFLPIKSISHRIKNPYFKVARLSKLPLSNIAQKKGFKANIRKVSYFHK